MGGRRGMLWLPWEWNGAGGGGYSLCLQWEWDAVHPVRPGPCSCPAHHGASHPPSFQHPHLPELAVLFPVSHPIATGRAPSQGHGAAELLFHTSVLETLEPGISSNGLDLHPLPHHPPAPAAPGAEHPKALSPLSASPMAAPGLDPSPVHPVSPLAGASGWLCMSRCWSPALPPSSSSCVSPAQSCSA